MIITSSQLQLILPHLAAARADVITDLLNTVGIKYQINTQRRMAAFVAEVAYESANFSAKAEDLYYTASRLVQVFPTHFPDLAAATPYQDNPEALANCIYANRMGNGDEASGDGYQFRGGGFIQLTGRDMYTAYAQYIKQDLDTASNLVRTDDGWAMDSAAWFFAVKMQLLTDADNELFSTITLRINGGETGEPQRLSYYNTAMKELATTA